MQIIFGGDFFSGGDLLQNPADKDFIQINEFFSADLRIVNLENPISDNEEVEDKSTLYASSLALKHLKAFKIDAVALANNHIQDKKSKGLSDTFKNLYSEDIKFFGAGKNKNEARSPLVFNVDNQKLALLGYCDFNKGYLKDVSLANDTDPGAAPLRYETILEDVEKIKCADRIVLFFHWGREHSWYPPKSDIDMTKKLLKHPKIILIIGTHPHLPQGYIKYNGKYAFMSLGNFLFPNFYIQKPVQIYYPKERVENYDVIRGYHPVSRITYKKWKFLNRISLLVNLDMNGNKIKFFPVIQDDNLPRVSKLQGVSKHMLMCWIFILSQIYKLPYFLYWPLEKTNTFLLRISRTYPIAFFYLREKGFLGFLKKVINFYSQNKVDEETCSYSKCENSKAKANK